MAPSFYFFFALQIRRSMRFSSRLQRIAADFRQSQLDSTDLRDRTVAPANGWRASVWPMAAALGGPYIAAHIRRKQFHASDQMLPSIDVLAN